MELQKIKILNYKSIKESIEIPFTNEGGIVTFIGKNGSGKTNILQAIRKSIDKQSGYYKGEKETIRSQYTLKVSKEDKEKYFSSVNVEKCENEIVVDFTNSEEHVKKVKAPILTESVGGYKSKIEKLLKNLSAAGKNYIAKLKEIEHSYDSPYYLNLKVKSDKRGNYAFLTSSVISHIENIIKYQVDNIKKYLKENFEGDYITITDHDDYNYLHISLNSIEFYQIATDEEIYISSIIAKSLGLNKEDIDRANKKLNKEIININNRLSKEYNYFNDCLQKIKDLANEIYYIFTKLDDQNYKNHQKIGERYKEFCCLLKDNIFKTGYYIDNEETLLFFNGNNGYRGRQLEYLNAKNPIWEAIHQFLLKQNYYKEEESILELDKIEESRLKYLEKKINKEFLSSLVSGFDKDEILGYRIAFNNKNVSIFVKEKSGEEIDINSTSLGRRWFLTYSFVNRLLEKGDFLFIDEPAAFLHPQAQIEFRKDLEQLASSKGVYVFITTHSPYMIPNNWANVHNVIMTEKGTQVQSFMDKDELCETIKEELGISRTSDILFNLSKTILLVEGVADKACIEKFARKLDYDLSNYHILPCNGSSIIGLTYLCIREKIKFKALLDADNKNKPKEWLNRQFGYKEYLEVIKNNKDCIFTPEDGARKCLEDCFSREDADKYFTLSKGQKKISCEEIETGEVFTDETLENFEQLFIKLGIPKIDKK